MIKDLNPKLTKLFKLPASKSEFDEEEESNFYENLLANYLRTNHQNSSTGAGGVRLCRCDEEDSEVSMVQMSLHDPQRSVLTAVIQSLLVDGEFINDASIGPPKNVRVQAISNSSVVVQWDFDEVANDGFADGFVVKYMHEPGSSPVDRLSVGAGQDKWRTQTVMDSKARHLEVTRLTQKPYAFCVLAVKQSRLGPCSDPPITLDKLRPTFVVQDLHVQYKTSQSVALHWEYSGPSQNIGFYIKQMGMKTYQDQFLEEKTLVSPGFEKKVEGNERYFLWQNLRPYMNHTFQVGVYSVEEGRMFWPRELSVQTDPTGPPFVDTPEFVQSPSPTTSHIRLSCASEEYGPINHYWLIVVPTNYTKEDVLNVDSGLLQRSTARYRASRTTVLNETNSATHEPKQSKTAANRRALKTRQTAPLAMMRQLDNVYISAQISSHQMQRLYRDERLFTLGDGREYEGYLNMPLDPNARYQLMTRAFTREDSWRRSAEHPVGKFFPVV
ncbi:fibronectin type III domain-containing protein [Ditylenchus destructor]|nr:fibronectin type III domain-containing protein [Ditylenchus destructor]